MVKHLHSTLQSTVTVEESEDGNFEHEETVLGKADNKPEILNHWRTFDGWSVFAMTRLVAEISLLPFSFSECIQALIKLALSWQYQMFGDESIDVNN